jgi:predicted LPLAT superfamily acyltransferase
VTENFKWRGGTGGGTFGQRALILLFRRASLQLGYAFLFLVIPFYIIFSRKSFFAIYHYFKQQLCFTKWKSFWSACRNHFLFGQVILDRFAVFAGRKNCFEVEIVGSEYYEKLASGDKGFVVVSSHIGNFEIAGYLLNAKKKRINALVFDKETPVMQQNRAKALNSNNIKIIPVVPDMSHLFAASVALTNGEIVSMPADRLFGSSKCLECEFMNGKADFPVGAFALATSLDVEVVVIFCVKISTKKYKIFVKPCSGEDCLPANKKGQITALTKKYVAELEKIVRNYPEQWFNYYEFWK